jgi:hypothetical protein
VGPLRGAKVVDARTGREAGVGKFHRLTFEARFERARGRMLVTLMEQPGGGWAVEGALLESIIMDP